LLPDYNPLVLPGQPEPEVAEQKEEKPKSLFDGLAKATEQLDLEEQKTGEIPINES
jgi:hypothetical protein